MLEYVRVRVGAETVNLERNDNGKWSKQIRAPSMSGQYGMIFEIGNADGSVVSCETIQSISVMGKRFDLGKYGKLNETLIKRIVLALSGYASHVLFSDSTIIVLVRMSKYDASVLMGIKKVLLTKIPAHLNLSVNKLYSACNDIREDFFSCGNVLNVFNSCQELLDYVPKHLGNCLGIIRDFDTCSDLMSYQDCRAVINRNAKDFAICNEINTGYRTCRDILNRYETCEEVLTYAPVEPLGEGF